MPPPKPRVRFNAKARQSSVGSSHKKRKQQSVSRRSEEGIDEGSSSALLDDAFESGSNTLMIDPVEERRRKDEDRQRRALIALQDPEAAEAPISSKKRKRLDAYIARQLKKEKRQQLIADLAKSSAEIGDRSALVTAASLGTGKARTGQDRLNQETAKAERVDRRRRNPFTVAQADEAGSNVSRSPTPGTDDGFTALPLHQEVGATARDDDREARIARARALFGEDSRSVEARGQGADGSALPVKAETSTQPAAAPALGSALAIGADGKPLQPIMRKKKEQAGRPQGRKTAWGREDRNDASDDTGSADEDSDFDSSASSSAEDEGSDDDDDAHRSLAAKLDDNEASLNGRHHEDESSSSDSSYSGDISDASDVSGIETDEDEQAILMEAMRQRGMLGNPDVGPPTSIDYAVSGDAEHSDHGAQYDESLPFTDFGEEEATPGIEIFAPTSGTDRTDRQVRDKSEIIENESDDGSSLMSGSDDDASVEESDEDGLGSEIAEIQSRRRGLPLTKKSRGFKDWANTALGITSAAEISDALDDEYRGPEPVAGLTHKVGKGDGTVRGPLGESEGTERNLDAFAQKHYEELKKSGGHQRRRYNVERSEELQEARLKLPVVADEDNIVRTISENMVTILCGETGSGKTTQVPQFLLEAGFGSAGSTNPGMIGVTQPRRVAALSMAARVGYELGLGPHRVSHQIRYDANVSPATSIKFMTDGVLLRELTLDFLLNKYSVVIIDEAHERSVNTDVLIGVLSRVIHLRAKRWLGGQGRPLRLVIMSATLRVDDFSANARLFDKAVPILQVEARQYPVVTHFSRRTHHDYTGETVKKACKIHARLPSGGILIFLTGQAEIATVCKRLEKRFGRQAIEQKLAAKERAQSRRRRVDANDEKDDESTSRELVSLPAKDGDVEPEDFDLGVDALGDGQDLAPDVDDGNAFDDEEALETDDDEAPEYDADLPEELRDDSDKPMHILPLYSLLPSDRQMQVFSAPPEGSRLVVVATNVAETSLTIPGISYVIDCGRSKERKYDAVNGVQSFEVGFISKASANQRAGRAGRTGPGHCYRLYSSNLYEEHMPTFTEPEILRTPVDNLVLMMKSMNIDNVANFPFPTPPDREALRRAEKLLVRLGALEPGRGRSPSTSVVSASENKVTPLGRAMSLFPLSTRLSKLLVQGHQHGCLPFVVALCAALSVGDPFIREESLHETQKEDADGHASEAALENAYLENEDAKEKERRKAKRSAYFKAQHRFASMSGALSDPLRLLSAVGAYEYENGALSFCERNFLVPKTMEEIHKLRGQIANLVRANAAPGVDVSGLSSPRLDPPTSQQLIVLRQFLLAAYIDQVAIRADLAPESAARVPMLQGDNQHAASDGAVSKQFYHQQKLGAKMQSTRNVAYLAAGVPHEACFIHKSSILYHQQPPEWTIFSEVVRSRAKGDRLERLGRNWLKGVTVVSPKWIYKLGPSLCSLSKPIESDAGDSRSRLLQATHELKRRQAAANGNGPSESTGIMEKMVHLLPSYGTGPAVDISERSSHVGWNLPPIAAKQRFSNGRWVTEAP